MPESRNWPNSNETTCDLIAAPADLEKERYCVVTVMIRRRFRQLKCSDSRVASGCVTTRAITPLSELRTVSEAEEKNLKRADQTLASDEEEMKK